MGALSYGSAARASAIDAWADDGGAIGINVLAAILTHWRALGRTSVAGLRESFLQREGRLGRQDAGWQLKVAARPFDMLLDRLPWAYKTLKFAWMEDVVHVDWR